jgi:hypothetical protein
VLDVSLSQKRGGLLGVAGGKGVDKSESFLNVGHFLFLLGFRALCFPFVVLLYRVCRILRMAEKLCLPQLEIVAGT